MIKIIINGYNGKMGMAVRTAISSDARFALVAGVDSYRTGQEDCPIFDLLKACDVPCDVVIDFSNASGTDALLEACREKKLSLVLCTTGLSDNQIKKVEEYSKLFPILRSANMSLGINIISDLVERAAAVLYSEDFDIEVIEKHHRLKVDSPSGTALLLADAANNALENKLKYVYDRTSYRKMRDKEELGIASVRGGSIVGEHEVIFAGADEVVSIKHEAFSRNVFAKGALAAAAFLSDKNNGLYSMKDVVR